MPDQQAELFDAAEGVIGDATFRLERLEVYNWGPFRGMHRAEFDPYGTAIIGPTGSGKTTLVDALMTLLVYQPRYNLASTGGHESDRTLFSYVRGALNGDGADGQDAVARPAKTTTGISATYSDGRETLTLAAIFWTDGTSNAAEDLKRRWIFSQAEGHSLERWLQLQHDDGVRELMRLGRETAKLQIFESKTTYLERTRRFFDVGENAFTLLNRAAGLKQLNSIDELFRELVLEDRAAFDRALEVAGEFDNLAAIRKELEIARKQQESLILIAEAHQEFAKVESKLARFQALKHIIPIWFAIVGRDKWSEVLQRILNERELHESNLKGEIEAEGVIASRVETLRERYLQLGGNLIGDLEKTIATQKQLIAERTKHATDYQRLIVAFKLSDRLTPEILRSNQDELRRQEPELQKKCEAQWKHAAVAQAQHDFSQRKREEIASSLQKVKACPGSNIPPAYQEFRAALAAQLRRSEEEVPYLAELIEVKTSESAWRGAIERALGSERFRILVPEDCLDSALSWVNNRNNQLHVRLRRARRDEQPVTFFIDGYSRKLNIKNHLLRRTAERLLAERDLHCVASTEALKNIEHGLTMEGMTSSRRGSFDKQDQRPLHQGWATGFDNQAQLAELAEGVHSATEAVAKWNAETESRRKLYRQLDEQLKSLGELIKVEFSRIDLPGAELDLAKSNERLKELLSPNSDAGIAKKALDAEVELLTAIQSRVNAARISIAKLDTERTNAEKILRRVKGRISRDLSEDETRLARQEFAVLPSTQADELDELERYSEDRIEKRLGVETDRLEEIQRRLVRLMESAKHVDTGALADVGSEMVDVPRYLDRLRVLKEEALPEKRRRFLEYLNRSSDQGVTQLLAGIEEEVDAIEQRIGELNGTLVKVDFREGRYLQLRPQRVKHERLRALETAIRKVRSAALKDDEGESHYGALRELVDILREAGNNSRQLGSRALLDPRYRLQFFVVEVDRQTGNESLPRTGSQSGSGGEKELMASHILTASLSYALCPTGASRPLYGTIILDEAFSKSSPSAAGRIIEALRVFCLHPIFVTPNKEIGLLKRHTRKAICVQRPAKEAVLASISWERLEELARQQ